MIVVRVELWPKGDQQRARLLGLMRIANDGSGSEALGNYHVTIDKSPEYAKRPGIYRRGRVQGFRRRLGPWPLLQAALTACLGRS